MFGLNSLNTGLERMGGKMTNNGHCGSGYRIIARFIAPFRKNIAQKS